MGNCTNGTTPKLIKSKSNTVFTAQPFIHYSKSLDGPFERLNISLPPGLSVSFGNDNPAPYIFPNGTVLMLIRYYNSTRAKNHIEPHDTIYLVTAPSFRGPYSLVFNRPVFKDENFNEEDPVLWRDHRGAFHALFHF